MMQTPFEGLHLKAFEGLHLKDLIEGFCGSGVGFGFFFSFSFSFSFFSLEDVNRSYGFSSLTQSCSSAS